MLRIYLFAFSLCALCLCGENLFAFFAFLATTSRISVVPVRILAQRQHSRSFSPPAYQFGGASCVSRRLLWHKILNSAPLSLLPAVHCGDNFRNCVNFNPIRNIAIIHVKPYDFLAPST